MSRKKTRTIIFFAILSFSITFSALGGLIFPIDPNTQIIIMPSEPIPLDINFGLDPNGNFSFPIDPFPPGGILFLLDPYYQWREGSYLETAGENELEGIVVKVNGIAGLDNCVLMPSETMEIDIEISEGHNIQTIKLDFFLSNTDAEFITDDVNFSDGIVMSILNNITPGIFAMSNYVPPAEGPAFLMTGLKVQCLGDTPVELVITVRENTIIDYKVFETDVDLHTVYIDQISQLRTVSGLEIIGPNEVFEDSEQQYDAIASYENGDTRKVTLLSQWTSEPNDHAVINEQGVLKSFLINYPQEAVTLFAEYSENSISVYSEKDVKVLASCTPGELVKRNLAQAEEMKLFALEQLKTALEKEEAAMNILNYLRKTRDFSNWKPREIFLSYINIFQSVIKEIWSVKAINESIKKLNNAQRFLNHEENNTGNRIPLRRR